MRGSPIRAARNASSGRVIGCQARLQLLSGPPRAGAATNVSLFLPAQAREGQFVLNDPTAELTELLAVRPTTLQ